MEEEQKTENFEEINESLINELTTIKFFSDQVRFNSVIYEGVQLILKKLTILEEIIKKEKEEKNGTEEQHKD